MLVAVPVGKIKVIAVIIIFVFFIILWVIIKQFFNNSKSKNILIGSIFSFFTVAFTLIMYFIPSEVITEWVQNNWNSKGSQYTSASDSEVSESQPIKHSVDTTVNSSVSTTISATDDFINFGGFVRMTNSQGDDEIQIIVNINLPDNIEVENYQWNIICKDGSDFPKDSNDGSNNSGADSIKTLGKSGFTEGKSYSVSLTVTTTNGQTYTWSDDNLICNPSN